MSFWIRNSLLILWTCKDIYSINRSVMICKKKKHYWDIVLKQRILHIEYFSLCPISSGDDPRRTPRAVYSSPGLGFDAVMMHQPDMVPSPAGEPGVPWCSWGNCREMLTDQERKCCGQEQARCVSLLPHFSQYYLEDSFIRIHRQPREDITALGNIREYRYGAYRHFIYWQHGALGQGNRLVIPSCCVWRIRELVQDTFIFIPGLWISFQALWHSHTVSLKHSQTCIINAFNKSRAWNQRGVSGIWQTLHKIYRKQYFDHTSINCIY